MKKLKKDGVYFLPLGGADEIGMNMYAYGCNGKWIVVDAGYGFLNDDYPGMDMCYASPEFLAEQKENVVGLFITHGHEDHMGAVAHLWPALGCKVYATPFAMGLIKERLKEYHLEDAVPLEVVRPQESVIVADFDVTYVPLAHSVPETCGLWIKTPNGNVFHATDWRFDDGQTKLLPTDWEMLEKIGAQGLDLFVCDSTNILVQNPQPTEEDVRRHLMKLVPQIKGGLIVTCFATNIMRLQSLLMAADKAQRTPVLLGRSLIKSVEIAKGNGYLQDLPQTHTIEEVPGLSPDQALYICTGSQANYRSALSIIAKGESKYVKLTPDDTIIFSSKIIPGNEDKIEKMQENMRDKGVTVITDETELVHASGHANQADLRRMYEILKPAVLLPVHGDKCFIREHMRFALKCGVSTVFSARNGDICFLKDGEIQKEEETFCDILGVDRGRSVSLGSDLIARRRQIAYNCSLFISVVVSSDYHLKDLQMTSLDILPADDWAALSERLVEELSPIIDEKLHSTGELTSAVQDFIWARIRRRIEKETAVKPVTVAHFYVEPKLEEGDLNVCNSK